MTAEVLVRVRVLFVLIVLEYLLKCTYNIQYLHSNTYIQYIQYTNVLDLQTAGVLRAAS